MKPQETLRRLRLGSPNVRFRHMRTLVERRGFRLVRVSGSHHIFRHPGVKELLNLQEVDGAVKRYQVQQFLRIVDEYRLRMSGDDD